MTWYANQIFGPPRPRELIQSGYVLLHTLDHHGVYLDGGYFDAHRSGFDWEPYRVD